MLSISNAMVLIEFSVATEERASRSAKDIDLSLPYKRCFKHLQASIPQ